MSDKERLEHIEGKVQEMLSLADSEGYAEVNILAIYNDMIWLISQVEKVERYEKVLNHWNTYFDFSQPVPKNLNELGTQKGVQRCFDIAKKALEGEK